MRQRAGRSTSSNTSGTDNHLEGTLFIDYLSRLKRQRAVDKVRKAQRQKAREQAA